MNKKKRILILKYIFKSNLYPNVELNYSSTFELLIAVLLSAQTTDLIVNKATTKLYLKANTPQTMLSLGLDGIKFYIRNINFFNKKAENIIKICHILLEKYDGKVPEDRTILESLPGVGRKTANIILNVAFGWPTIAVDRHIFRFCNRTKFALGKNTKQVEKKLVKIVPNKFKLNCHNYFLFYAKNICTARKPNCFSCIIKDLCEYKHRLN